VSDPGDPGKEPDPGADKPQPKQIEKIKADNEKPIEKIKADNEKLKDIKNEKEFKPEKFEKSEKHEKNEFKELKNEKFEKNELKEHKNEKLERKEIKEIKWEKLEIKERKPELEKQQVEGPVDPTGGIDPAILSQHADALEEAARQLRHFIEQGERPDLSRGALKDEPDQGGDA
jgi:hypothetical protein